MQVQTQVPAIGLEPLEAACRLHDLAVSLRAQGQYAEALASSQQALVVFEREVGPDHPDVATVLNTLAGIHQAQGEYAEAERLYRRSGEILDAMTASRSGLGALQAPGARRGHRRGTLGGARPGGGREKAVCFAYPWPLHLQALTSCPAQRN